MALPKSWTTVTPLSRKIALVCFVLFPIIGFFLGVRYQQVTGNFNDQTTRYLPESWKPIKTIVPQNKLSAKLQTYVSSKYSFIFGYPSAYTLHDKDGNNITITTGDGTDIISISVTDNPKDFINDSLYKSCAVVLADSYKGKANQCVDYSSNRNLLLGGARAKKFDYVEAGMGGSGFEVIQTEQKPFLQMELVFADGDEGNGSEVFDQILTSFRFIVPVSPAMAK